MLVSSSAPTISDFCRTNELSLEAVAACQRGERDALQCFVQCYEQRVFAYLSRSLGSRYPIEDLAQEVFVRAYPSLLRFDVKGSAKLSTWLLSIAHRVAVDARRRNRTVSEPLEPEMHPSCVPSPEELMGQEQLLAAVARAIEQLSVEQREVFVLATFHELSVAEISEVTGAFEATVKTRLFRARTKLQLALGPHFAVTS